MGEPQNGTLMRECMRANTGHCGDGNAPLISTQVGLGSELGKGKVHPGASREVCAIGPQPVVWVRLETLPKELIAELAEKKEAK